MKKLLIVYNTCGLSGSENVNYYIDAIRSLVNQSVVKQDPENFKIAISSCANFLPTQHTLMQYFKDNCVYNFVDSALPLSITFNDTVEKCVAHFGEFEGYLYIDSGINFWDPSCRNDGIEKLWQVHMSGPNAVTAAFPSNDDGSSWWGIQYNPQEDYVYKIGQATNMHCQIFSNEWRLAYGKILPDIFASNCMESVFSQMAAAIHKRYVMTLKVHVMHLHSLDGASQAARRPRPDMHPMSKTFETPGKLFITTKTVDEKYRDGFEYGFGIEECKDYWKHDPSKFLDGKALDERLLPFLKKELFLAPQDFEYSQINASFFTKTY